MPDTFSGQAVESPPEQLKWGYKFRALFQSNPKSVKVVPIEAVECFLTIIILGLFLDVNQDIFAS